MSVSRPQRHAAAGHSLLGKFIAGGMKITRGSSTRTYLRPVLLKEFLDTWAVRALPLTCHLRAAATALHVLRLFCVPSSALYVVAFALHHGFESHSLRHVFNNLACERAVFTYPAVGLQQGCPLLYILVLTVLIFSRSFNGSLCSRAN